MLYGVAATVEFFVIDTSTGKGKTGDSANLTMRWNKDGTAAATTNAPSEVDATNQPGLYKITITATEAQCLSGTLHGKSSTANIEVLPRHFDPVRLPNVDPGASGGLPTTDANNAVKIQSNVKKNQALSGFTFLMKDTTGVPQTGKTVTVTRSIDGGAFAAGTLGTVSEVSNGEYKVDFGAGDLNGNVIMLRATASGCADTFVQIITQP